MEVTLDGERLAPPRQGTAHRSRRPPFLPGTLGRGGSQEARAYAGAVPGPRTGGGGEWSSFCARRCVWWRASLDNAGRSDRCRLVATGSRTLASPKPSRGCATGGSGTGRSGVALRGSTLRPYRHSRRPSLYLYPGSGSGRVSRQHGPGQDHPGALSVAGCRSREQCSTRQCRPPLVAPASLLADWAAGIRSLLPRSAPPDRPSLGDPTVRNCMRSIRNDPQLHRSRHHHLWRAAALAIADQCPVAAGHHR